MKSLVVLLWAFVTCMFGLPASGAAPSVLTPAPVIAYDVTRELVESAHTVSEHGPPAHADGFTAYGAADRWSRGASRNQCEVAASRTYIYNHLVSLAQVAPATGSGEAQVLSGDVSSLPANGVAAEAEAGAARACEGGLCGIPGKTCFVAGTLIRTERGDIPIELVVVGDKVWSRNIATGKDELQPVAETYVRHADALLKLTVAGAVLTTTADHPFMVKDRGWVKAGDLQVGDVLFTPTGTTVLAGIEHMAKGATVYNFQVAVNHDYYALAGTTPVLVHNADYGDLISRPGQIADRFGATAREVKDAIHQAKTNLPRGGSVRNPDVSVDPVSGEIYPQLPGGGFGDSIGNMWDLLGKG